MESHEKKYKEALELARDYYKANLTLNKADENAVLEDIFPELKESEDERIRKELIRYFKGMNFVTQEGAEKATRWISWLEKQGKQKTICAKCKKEHPSHFCQDISALGRCALEHEQKSADNKVVPKFNVGDWIVNYNSGGVYQVTEIRDDEYCLWPLDGEIMGYLRIIDVDDDYRLWTIHDAKDGDILIYNDSIFIFKETYGNYYLIYYGIYKDNKFNDDKCDFFLDLNTIGINNIHPATEHQHDILLRGMRKEGYEFDFEKKELKKIEIHNSDKVETKFNIGDWITDGYLHCKISDVLDDRYIVDTKSTKRSAIPFKRENEYHLWTIEDAKDGDILVSNYGKPFIYNGNHNSRHVGAYCGISAENRFNVATEKCRWTANVNIRPATKDQRDILMNAMNDDCYVFDFDKKELKKMIYLSAKHNSQPIRPTDE